ncbi:MAG: FecR family protein [Opitutaceae bacterium]
MRDPHSETVLDLAASWHAHRDAGLAPAEEVELAHWLAADPGHASAFRECENAWATLDQTHENNTAGALLTDLSGRARRRRLRVCAGTVTSVVACAAAVFVFRPQPAASSRPPESTAAIVRADRRVLSDGTVVELNRGSDVSVNYTPTQRRVRLERGEAHFTVTQDTHRPFFVSAGAIELRAVGTAFSVRFEPEAVDVVVTEGKVAVQDQNGRSLLSERTTPTTEAPSVPVLAAGERATLAANDRGHAAPAVVPEPMPVAEIERRLAWRSPHLELSATRLQDAITLLNQENRLQIAIADPELAETRVSGVFRADNAEGFVRLLETTYGIRAERTGGGVVLRSGR